MRAVPKTSLCAQRPAPPPPPEQGVRAAATEVEWTPPLLCALGHRVSATPNIYQKCVKQQRRTGARGVCFSHRWSACARPDPQCAGLVGPDWSRCRLFAAGGEDRADCCWPHLRALPLAEKWVRGLQWSGVAPMQQPLLSNRDSMNSAPFNSEQGASLSPRLFFFFSFPLPSGAPLGGKSTAEPPSVALQPPSVTLQPPSVTVQPLSATW